MGGGMMGGGMMGGVEGSGGGSSGLMRPLPLPGINSNVGIPGRPTMSSLPPFTSSSSSPSSSPPPRLRLPGIDSDGGGEGGFLGMHGTDAELAGYLNDGRDARAGASRTEGEGDPEDDARDAWEHMQKLHEMRNSGYGGAGSGGGNGFQSPTMPLLINDVVHIDLKETVSFKSVQLRLPFDPVAMHSRRFRFNSSSSSSLRAMLWTALHTPSTDTRSCATCGGRLPRFLRG